MGLFDALLGNASETDAQAVAEELAPVLGAGESVVSAYKLVRDLIVFTSGRMILIDKQGLTGRKVNYHSIPYKSITQFVVETAGHFDTDSAPIPGVHPIPEGGWVAADSRASASSGSAQPYRSK